MLLSIKPKKVNLNPVVKGKKGGKHEGEGGGEGRGGGGEGVRRRNGCPWTRGN